MIQFNNDVGHAIMSLMISVTHLFGKLLHCLLHFFFLSSPQKVRHLRTLHLSCVRTMASVGTCLQLDFSIIFDRSGLSLSLSQLWPYSPNQ